MNAACKRHRWTEFNRCARCSATRVRRVRGPFGLGYETELAQVSVTEGGWYYPDKAKGEAGWLTSEEIRAAEHRWYERAQATAIPEDATDYMPLQCGGCKFFAAAGADWGICWNAKSPHDGRMVFEHNGCREHSFAAYAFAHSRETR